MCVFLRPVAHAGANADDKAIERLATHHAVLIGVRGHSLVDDGHEDGEHTGEEARERHVEAAVEERDLGPALAVSAEEFLALWVPYEEEKVVKAIAKCEMVFDDQILFVH